MFVELMPLLASRTVLVTVAKVNDQTLRVNVIPHGKSDDNPALSTPLTCTGSPVELDAELGQHLAGYVQTYQHTASSLADAKATLEAAAKAAQEEAKRKRAIQKPADKVTASSTNDPEPTLPSETIRPSGFTGTLGLFPPTSPEPVSTR